MRMDIKPFNVNAVNFGTSLGAWGWIVGFTLEDAAVAPSVRVYYATLARPRLVVANTPVLFEPGDLVVEEQ